MSKTTVYVVTKNGDLDSYAEVRNGIRSGPLTWKILAEKYLGMKEGFRIVYDDEAAQRLWNLKNDPRISVCDYAVLLSTFDRFICPREHFAHLADQYDQWAKERDDPGNFGLMGDVVRRVAADPAEHVGIAYQLTSVSENLWSVYDKEADEYRPYNVNVDVGDEVAGIDGHFFFDPSNHPAKRAEKGGAS